MRRKPHFAASRADGRPHCNGADKAAHKLASFGRPVKKMIGGVTGWEDEGLSLVTN